MNSNPFCNGKTDKRVLDLIIEPITTMKSLTILEREERKKQLNQNRNIPSEYRQILESELTKILGKIFNSHSFLK